VSWVNSVLRQFLPYDPFKRRTPLKTQHIRGANVPIIFHSLKIIPTFTGSFKGKRTEGKRILHPLSPPYFTARQFYIRFAISIGDKIRRA